MFIRTVRYRLMLSFLSNPPRRSTTEEVCATARLFGRRCYRCPRPRSSYSQKEYVGLRPKRYDPESACPAFHSGDWWHQETAIA